MKNRDDQEILIQVLFWVLLVFGFFKRRPKPVVKKSRKSQADFWANELERQEKDSLALYKAKNDNNHCGRKKRASNKS
jgi:hypothetical protein